MAKTTVKIRTIRLAPSYYIPRLSLIIFSGAIASITAYLAFKGPYFDFFYLSTSIFLGGIASYLLFFFLDCMSLQICHLYIQQKSLFRKKRIYKKDITLYSEYSYQGHNMLRIESLNTKIYMELKQYSKTHYIYSFLKNKKRNDNPLKKYTIYSTYAALFYIFLDCSLPIIIPSLLSQDKSYAYIVVHANGIEATEETYKFTTEEYPHFFFELNSSLEHFPNLQQHERINIKIRKTDCAEKLLKTTSPSWKTKHFNWEKILVYDFE